MNPALSRHIKNKADRLQKELTKEGVETQFRQKQLLNIIARIEGFASFDELQRSPERLSLSLVDLQKVQVANFRSESAQEKRLFQVRDKPEDKDYLGSGYWIQTFEEFEATSVEEALRLYFTDGPSDRRIGEEYTLEVMSDGNEEPSELKVTIEVNVHEAKSADLKVIPCVQCSKMVYGGHPFEEDDGSTTYVCDPCYSENEAKTYCDGCGEHRDSYSAAQREDGSAALICNECVEKYGYQED